MQNASEGTYFLSEDRGVYLTNGSGLKPISDQIQPTIDAIDGQRTQTAAVYFNGHYYLSCAGSGTGANDTTLDYDVTLNSWWRHTFGSNQFAIWHPIGSAQLFSAKATGAIIDRAFDAGVNQDNGTNFQWRWAGPWQSPSYYRRRLFPTPFYRKRLRQVRCDGLGTVDFSLAKDFASTESLIESDVFGAGATPTTWAGGGLWADPSFLWAGSLGIAREKLFSLGVANAFSVVFSSTANTPDQVTSFLLVLHDRKDSLSTN
jgi:hypothetical protein